MRLLWVLRKIWGGICFVGISRSRVPPACSPRAGLPSPARGGGKGAGEATPSDTKSRVQTVTVSQERRQARPDLTETKRKIIQGHNTQCPARPLRLVFILKCKLEQNKNRSQSNKSFHRIWSYRTMVGGRFPPTLRFITVRDWSQWQRLSSQ